MNKYNVRAIRNELDSYIRHASWKNFRSRLQGLDLELRRAVVEYRPTSNGKGSKKRHSPPTLLHALCGCVHMTPPVPVDILESVLEASPHSLYATRSAKTPLSIALDRQASPTILECLIHHDINRESLYIADNKTGDTPILQAIKQQANDDVILLLVRHDTTKQSLLIPSKKRNRVPLFYVANQELSFVDLDEDEIPGELEYMLLQTHDALKIHMRESVASDVIFQSARCDDEECLFGSDDNDSYDSSYEDDQEGDSLLPSESEEGYFIKLLQAVVACAHFLGDKHSICLISFLLTRIPDLSLAIDQSGNTILHQLCQSTHVFVESALLQGRLMTETIIQHHKKSTITRNAQGRLPIHVGLESKKTWDDVLGPMVEAAPETVHMAITADGRLPLHLAVLNYHSRSREIHNLWRLYPEAAAIQDPSMGLFPFQLAALEKEFARPPPNTDPQGIEKLSILNSGSRKIHQKAVLIHPDMQQDLDQLSDIYFFLRSSPQVLREMSE